MSHRGHRLEASAAKTAPSEETRRWRDSSQGGVSILAARYLRQRFSPHSHDRFVVAAILSGGAFSRYDGRARTVGPGSLVIIPPGMIHDGRPIGHWEHFAIYAPREFLSGLFGESSNPGAEISFRQLVYSDPEVFRQFELAHRIYWTGDEQLARESAVIDALGSLIQRHAVGRRAGGPRASQSNRSQRRAVDRSIELMRGRLEENLTIEDLAQAAGYSKFHFLRIFKSETGQTPHAYLMRCRVAKARRRLRAGEPIAETAFATGFADQAHLSRRFKELTGVTPGEFSRGSGA